MYFDFPEFYIMGKLELSEEMEETLKRIQESKNVVGVVVANRDGLPIKSSLDSTMTAQVKAETGTTIAK